MVALIVLEHLYYNRYMIYILWAENNSILGGICQLKTSLSTQLLYI